jgi:hypothetical protein
VRHRERFPGGNMTLYQPPTTQDRIIRPPCAKCGTITLLSRIEPEGPAKERWTFECSRCGHSESVIGKSP